MDSKFVTIGKTEVLVQAFVLDEQGLKDAEIVRKVCTNKRFISKQRQKRQARERKAWRKVAEQKRAARV